jgi:hypothetical protein
MHTPHVASGGRYPVLRALAILYVFGAALTAIGAVLYALYTLLFTHLGWSDRMIIAGGTVVGGFLGVISLLAVAELLKLFIDLEHNTRMAVPGRIGMPASVEVTVSGSDGGATVIAPNRITALDEETAEAALIRGH